MVRIDNSGLESMSKTHKVKVMEADKVQPTKCLDWAKLFLYTIIQEIYVETRCCDWLVIESVLH